MHFVALKTKIKFAQEWVVTFCISLGINYILKLRSLGMYVYISCSISSYLNGLHQNQYFKVETVRSKVFYNILHDAYKLM